MKPPKKDLSMLLDYCWPQFPAAFQSEAGSDKQRNIDQTNNTDHETVLK